MSRARKASFSGPRERVLQRVAIRMDHSGFDQRLHKEREQILSPARLRTLQVLFTRPESKPGSPMQPLDHGNASTHGPAWREPQRKVKGSYRTRFNPRALVGANATQERIIFVSLVSISAPTWARTYQRTKLRVVRVVSIHAPAWARTGDVPALSGSILVSIHAPVRAQTRHRQRCGLLLRVSIHAPT